MTDYQYQFTITRSSVTSTLRRIPSLQTKTLDEVTQALDEACCAARADKQMFEICDSYDPDQDTERYILKLQFPGETRKLIGVVVRERRVRSTSGALGLLLITTCAYDEAHQNFQNGEWKSVDGQPLLTPPKTEIEAADVRNVVDEIAGQAEPEPEGSAWHRRRGSGTAADREAFVLELLRRDPGISAMGKGGIHELVKDKFGIGMREGKIAQLRARVESEPQGSATPSQSELQAAMGAQVDALIDLDAARTRAISACTHVTELVGRIGV